MADIFKNISVVLSPQTKYSLVSWDLDPRFSPESGTYTFYVEAGYSAGNWTRLNSTPIINQAYYLDTTSYKYGLIDNVYYRIVLIDNSAEYISVPENASGNLTTREFRIVKNILRQEYERLIDIGVSGWLLRRRHWGTVCASCKDFDLEHQVSKPNCFTCYGTGIVDGYYNAYPYYIEFLGGSKSQIELKPPFGVEDTILRQGRCVSYPLISSFDIWVAANTDTRYIIRTVQTIAELKERPVIYTVALNEIPAGQIEYSIPLQTSESSSSGIESLDQSWRTDSSDFLQR